MNRVLVIGGGIAGLASAHEILRRGLTTDLCLLEAEDRLGGNIRTSREDGFTLEWGVNGFLDSVPETLELVQEIALGDELLPAGNAAGRRFIYRGGRLREIPLKPPAFFRSDLLSPRGRLRILGEPFARPRPDGDETVYSFAARRIGREAAEILVDPMVSGVYAGDARRLSLRSTFPRMEEMEREHGSLVRALLARRKAARSIRSAPASKAGGPAGPAGTLTSFRSGMETIIDRLAERIGRDRIRLRSPALRIERGAAGYRVLGEGNVWEAERLVVAAPARQAARILGPLDSALGRDLSGISYAGLAVVALVYKLEDLDAAPDGFGFLVPRGQGVRILGCLWDASVFSQRAPAGWVLLRAMIGGAQDPKAVEMEDEELLRVTQADLRTTMGIQVAPRWTRIYRHPLGIPQYEVGHGERLGRIEERLAQLPGIVLAGNSYRGIAVNSCVKEAKELGARWARSPSERWKGSGS